MPIYMDLHKVPGITAKDAAEAHCEDLKIQEKFGCRCMTYWVDEDRDSAFCLIEAPGKTAVIDMHNEAHGLVPHQIIEVNPNIVEAFLGRIHDPDFLLELKDPKYRVFTDAAVRTILVVKTTDFNLLKSRLGEKVTLNIQKAFRKTLEQEVEKQQGRLVELRQKYCISSFKIFDKALETALNIYRTLTDVVNKLELQMSIGEGLPVTQNPKIFGETLQVTVSKFLLNESKPLLLSPKIKTDSISHIKSENLYKSVNAVEEKKINQIFKILDANWENADFNLSNFSSQMAMSKSSLYRNCKSLTGKSPNSLLKQFRLLQSLDLFQRRNSVARISYDSGFNSPAYFSQCFQQQFGIKPGEYQKQI